MSDEHHDPCEGCAIRAAFLLLSKVLESHIKKTKVLTDQLVEAMDERHRHKPRRPKS